MPQKFNGIWDLISTNKLARIYLLLSNSLRFTRIEIIPLTPARTWTVLCEFSGIVTGWVSVIGCDVVAFWIVCNGQELWKAFTW